MTPLNKIHNKQCLSVSLLLVGLFLGAGSLICILLLPSFITNQINERMVLKNGSTILNRWSKPNVPIHFKVWLFDVTNAQQVIDSKDTKPILKEIGPFVFRLIRSKDIISFAGDNVYYTEKKVYHFTPELSCCAINTTVTVPNIPLVAIVDKALSYNLPLVGRFIPRLINRAIQSLRERLFVTRQVNELLFDGYDVELLKMISRVGSLVGLPQTNKKFALLKGRNGTWRPEQDGVWGINTGQKDRRLFGRVSSWNSYKQLPFWNGPTCNTINGSDGTLFAPPIETSEPLYVFNPELCRTVNLIYDQPTEVRSIDALRFVLNPLNFAPTVVPPEPPNRANNLDSASRLSGPAETNSNQLSPSNSGQVVVTTSSGNLSPSTRTSSGGLIHGAQRRHDTSQNMEASADHGQHHHHQLQVASSRQISRLTAQSSNNNPRVADFTSLNLAHQPPHSISASLRSDNNLTGVNNIFSEELKPNKTNNNQLTNTESNSINQHHADTALKVAQAAQESHDYREHRDKLRLNPLLCFCDRKATNLNGVNICEFDGLIDLSKCAKQTQVIFGSMPHFYLSDPRLLKQVHGLEPNSTKHTTYLDIEPNTGLVLGGKRRFQLNIMMKHNLEVEGFENIIDMLVPVMWIEESALIPEESAKKFKSLYTDRIRMINIILFSLIFASVTLILVDLRLIALQSDRLSNLLKSFGILLAFSSKQNFSVQKASTRHSIQAANSASGFLSPSQSSLSSASSESLEQSPIERNKMSVPKYSDPMDLKRVRLNGGSNVTSITDVTASASTISDIVR